MKSLLSIVILLATFSAFGMGRNDNSAIESTLDAAKSQGLACQEVWPENFYLGNVGPQGTYTLDVNCKDSNGMIQKSGKVVYRALGSPGAKCRDTVALSIELK